MGYLYADRYQVYGGQHPGEEQGKRAAGVETLRENKMSQQEANRRKRPAKKAAGSCSSSKTVRQLKKQLRETAEALRAGEEKNQAIIKTLKKSRRDFLAIFDSVPAIIWYRDRSGCILKANQCAADSIGCGVRELIGKNYYELVPDSAGLARRRDAAVIGSGRPSQHDMCDFVRYDGAALRLMEDRFPLRDKDGKVIGVMVFAQDVTEKIRAEERLVCANREIELRNEQLRIAAQHAEKLAEQASRSNLAKSEILASSSHDLRTPMNAIIGFAELLLETKLDDEQTEYVKTIRQSATGLLSLINDILDFTKLEADKLKIQIVPFELSAFIRDIASMIRPQMFRKKLDFTIHIDPCLPDRLYTDPLRLRQCLINLLGNAMKFTESGSVALHVGPCRRNAGRGIRFDVEDTGIGIPKDKQRSIFRSYSQAEDSTERRFGGTGLGLTITRKLVDLLGGHITVTSEPAKGSVFSIVLPLPEAVAASDDQSAVQPPAVVEDLRAIDAPHDPDELLKQLHLLADQLPEVLSNDAADRIDAIIDALTQLPACRENPAFRRKVKALKADVNTGLSSQTQTKDILNHLEQICRQVNRSCQQQTP
jgi:PAS domain S-box-containing protein